LYEKIPSSYNSTHTLSRRTLFGYKIFRPQAKEEITSNVVLTALRVEGFLVSQNYIFNQTITIDRSTGSAFKDFFLGQTIDANANMKVSSGVDLSKLRAKRYYV
jgi:tryptophanase